MTKFSKIATALVAPFSFGVAAIVEAPAFAKAPVTMTEPEMAAVVPKLADFLCTLAKQNSAAFGNAAYNRAYGHRAGAVQLVDAWVIQNQPGLIASEQAYGYSVDEVLVQPMKDRIMRACS